MGMRCSHCSKQVINIVLNLMPRAWTEDDLSTDTENFSAEGP